MERLFASNEKKIYAYLNYQKNYKLEKNIVDEIVTEKSSAIASNNSKSISSSSSKTYVVKKGDTLSAIARKYGNITVAQLMKKNNIKNASSLKPGMKLKI